MGVGYQLPQPEEPARPRGLPLGNLTSQWLANAFITPVDDLAKRELRIRRYVRFMDDILLFSDEKEDLVRATEGIRDAMANRRLAIHERAAGVHAVETGVPFLGFRV